MPLWLIYSSTSWSHFYISSSCKYLAIKPWIRDRTGKCSSEIWSCFVFEGTAHWAQVGPRRRKHATARSKPLGALSSLYIRSFGAYYPSHLLRLTDLPAGPASHHAIHSYAALTDPDPISPNQPIISAMSVFSPYSILVVDKRANTT